MEIFIDEAISRVLSETGNTLQDTLPIRRIITYYSIYKELILSENMKVVSSNLGLSVDIIEKITSRTLYPLHLDKPKNIKWSSWLLALINYKRCNICNRILNRPLCYSKDSHNWDTYNYACKECKAVDRAVFTYNNPEYNNKSYLKSKSAYIARSIQYKTKRKLATPPWANLDKIKEIYDTCPEGYHVDHIIPLQGNTVSGLHVENNLRHLPALENIQKSNKYRG